MHVFVDGQNLFKSANRAFGYEHPNFDIMSLSMGLAKELNCRLGGIHFYTGIPGVRENPKWHDFWARKLVDMGRCGVEIYSPPLRYHTHTEKLPDGRTRETHVGREKGVDVRIALDMMKHALFNTCDNMMVISRDNDLAEAAKEAQLIAKSNQRRLEVWSAYPNSKECSHMGIRGTRWMPMEADFYNAHLDHRNYFKPKIEENLKSENRSHAQSQKIHIHQTPDLVIAARAEKATNFLNHADQSRESHAVTEKNNDRSQIQRQSPRL